MFLIISKIYLFLFRTHVNLHYNWYVYEEPGTYKGMVEIESDKQGMCVLHIPEDATGKNFHLILELNDDGVPSLTGYRRFVIHVK